MHLLPSATLQHHHFHATSDKSNIFLKVLAVLGPKPAEWLFASTIARSSLSRCSSQSLFRNLPIIHFCNSIFLYPSEFFFLYIPISNESNIQKVCHNYMWSSYASKPISRRIKYFDTISTGN
jgi:hypothetical protein